MVEPISMAVGTGMSVIGLYRACIEIIDTIDTAKGFEKDSQMLLTLFDTEKLLLTKWGARVGIGGRKDRSLHPCLDGKSRDYFITRGILRQLHILLTDTEILTYKYGIEPGSLAIATRLAGGGPSTKEKKPALGRKLAWGGWNKQKFEVLLKDIGTFVQKLHDLVTFGGLEMGDLVKELSVLQSFLECESTESREFRSDMEEMRGDIKSFIDVYCRKALLDWIRGVSTDEQYEEATRERQAGTCTWIHFHEKFLDWFGSPGDQPSVLWLHGGPGIGKTFLAASIVQHLKYNSARPTAFFFCTHEDSRKNQIISILRSWVSQLAAQRESALEVVRKLKPEVGDATQTLMWKVLKAMLFELGSCYLVLDGYDECLDYDPGSRARLEGSRKLFLTDLMLAIQSTGAKVIMTSRYLGEIKSCLGLDDPTSQLAFVSEHPITKDDTAEDIRIVARAITDSKISSTQDRNGISNQLSDDCQGMFLWLRLEGQRLKKGMRPDRVNEILATAPRGLGQAYKRDLVRISKMEQYDRKKVEDILRWMLYAFRPLSVIELLQFTEVNINRPVRLDEYKDIDEDVIEARILNPCGSFIEVRQGLHSFDNIGDSTVHFVHFSAKEFLLNLRDDRIEYNLDASFYPDSGRDHGILHDTCLVYTFLRPMDHWSQYPTREQLPLIMSQFSGKELTLEERESMKALKLEKCRRFITKYAYDYWAEHFYLSRGSKRVECVGIQKQLLVPGHRFMMWFYKVLAGRLFPGYLPIKCIYYEANLTPLHAAAYLGLPELLQGFLTSINKAPVDVLNFAILGKQQNIVSLLLRRDDIDVNSTYSTSGFTPLVIASSCGQEAIVQMLFNKRGIDVNKQAPLTYACKAGYKLVVQQFLARNDIDVNAKDVDGYTPLEMAVLEDKPEALELLLSSPDVKVNAPKTEGWALLYTAVSWGRQAIAILLLSIPDINVNAVNASGETLLHTAVYWGRKEVIKLLLSRDDININAAKKNGQTPLHLASEVAYLPAVEFLLAKDSTEVNALGESGMTPLDYAITGEKIPYFLNGRALGSMADRTRIKGLLRQKGGMTRAEIRQLKRASNLPDLSKLQIDDQDSLRIHSVGTEGVHDAPQPTAVITQRSAPGSSASLLSRPTTTPTRETFVFRGIQNSIGTGSPYYSHHYPPVSSAPTVASHANEAITPSSPVYPFTFTSSMAMVRQQPQDQRRCFSRVE